MKKLFLLILMELVIAMPAAYCYAYSSRIYKLPYNPTIIATGNGYVFLANYKRKSVVRINSVNREMSISRHNHRIYGIFINGGYIFIASGNEKYDIAGMDSAGNIYGIGGSDASLYEFTDAGKYMRQVKGRLSGILSANITFTKNDEMWTMTSYGHILKYGRSRELLETYKIPFATAFGYIAIDKDGDIWIATDNNTVIELNRAGGIINRYNLFSNGQTAEDMTSICTINLKTSKSGNIWIYDPRVILTHATEHMSRTGVVSNEKVSYTSTGKNILMEMSPAGDIIKKYHIPAVNAPYAMAIDKSGNVWIAVGNDKLMEIINK